MTIDDRSGDYVRALVALGVKEASTAAAIARLMRLSSGEEGVKVPPSEPENRAPMQPRTSPSIPNQAPARRATSDGASGTTRTMEMKPGISLLKALSPAHLPVPDWMQRLTSLENVVGAAPAGRAPAAAPLFPDRRARGILTAALATERGEGEIDVPALVSSIARGGAAVTLPRRKVTTLSRGVQLLVDVGPALLPFREDVRGLERDVLRLVGAASLEIVRFEGTPLGRVWRDANDNRDAVDDPGGDYRERYLPRPGTRVLCVTDLGIGAPAEGRRWAGTGCLAFTEALAAAGCPFVALVPYGRGRWPRGLARRIPILHWDRRTSAAVIARVLRDRARSAAR